MPFLSVHLEIRVWKVRPASLCVSFTAFVLDASKKNQFLPLGKVKEEHCCTAAWHLWDQALAVYTVYQH